jgi:hypothetical protein
MSEDNAKCAPVVREAVVHARRDHRSYATARSASDATVSKSVPLEVASLNADGAFVNIGDLLKLAGAMQEDQPFHRFLDTGGQRGEPGVSGGDGDDMTFEEWAAVSGHKTDAVKP